MRSHLGFVLAALMVFGVGACATGGAPAPGPRDTVDGEELPMGEEPRDDEFTEEADRFFRLAAEAEQDSAFAEARARYADALEAAESAIEADTTNPKGYYQAGLANLGIEDFAAADTMFARAQELHPPYQLQIDPLRAQYWVEKFNAGVEAMQAGNEDEALRQWEQADAIWEGRPEAMLNLGSLYASRGQPERAAEEFEGALEVIDSEAIEAVDSATAANWRTNAEIVRGNLARIYSQLERYDDAIEIYEASLARDPNDVQALTDLALVLVRAERPDSAQVIYGRLLEQPDLGGDQLFNIGVGLYQMGAFEQASEAFRNAAETNPYNRDALQNLGQSLFQRMQEEEVSEARQDEIAQELADVGEQLIEVDPYSPAGYELQAQGLVRLGQDQEAVAVLEGGDALPFNVVGTRVQPSPDGGGTLTGQVLNRSLDPGATIEIRFTLYATGTELGTSTVRIQAPNEGETAGFSTTVQGTEPATGYSYEVVQP